MKQIKIFYSLIFILIFIGCSALPRSQSKQSKAITANKGILAPVSQSPTQLENVKNEEEIVEPKGVVFGKTDFQGVLKTSYVRLFLEDQLNELHKFQLHIGDKASQDSFPWNVKVVEPGYFFIELPVGKYKISSVSIPVGSTLATEDCDAHFEVIPNEVVYLGTLRMNGIKEKIKLGGVPVIKPGFEYTTEVIDEHQDGILNFKKNYPKVTNNIRVKLLRVLGYASSKNVMR